MSTDGAARWTLWLFRFAVTLAAVVAFTQAVLAGGFLAGHFGMLAMHRDNSTIAVVAALVMVVAGVLFCLAILVAETVQASRRHVCGRVLDRPGPDGARRAGNVAT